eukprot:1147901-Pelagomonas_calceolata.AAC.12
MLVICNSVAQLNFFCLPWPAHIPSVLHNQEIPTTSNPKATNKDTGNLDKWNEWNEAVFFFSFWRNPDFITLREIPLIEKCHFITLTPNQARREA